MVVCRRGPYLTKAAFRHQALAANRVPEWATDCAGVGAPVEDGAHHFHFAGPGIAMFADVAVKAQGPVVLLLAHPFLLQKVNGKNGCVSAVSAAQRERPI